MLCTLLDKNTQEEFVRIPSNFFLQFPISLATDKTNEGGLLHHNLVPYSFIETDKRPIVTPVRGKMTFKVNMSCKLRN